MKREKREMKRDFKKRPLKPRLPTTRYQFPKDAKIDYKNLPLLQKFLNERGKIVPRRITGVSAKDQRHIVVSIKRARFLALLPTGAVKK